MNSTQDAPPRTWLDSTIAVVRALETKSLLLGEAASREDAARIEAAITAGDDVNRIIHMRTLHLGPEELLVAAKIAVRPDVTAGEVARTIDAAEDRIRAAVPIARVIYLEPDLYAPGRQPGGPAGSDRAAVLGGGSPAD